MDGVLLIDKPKGWTSTRVVEKVRRKIKVKVGHTGTLDPIATGLLVLLTGRATRFSWIFQKLPKTYEVTGLLGVVTDTYDLEGDVLEEREVKVSCEELEGVLENFRGEIDQVPPPFSAKRIRGKRAYDLARRGIKPDLKPVKVTVHRLDLKDCRIPEFTLIAEVSSGTYVRTLIHDIGRELSCGAVVKDLVRKKVGPFSLEEAVSLDEFLSSDDPDRFIMRVDEGLSFLPPVNLNAFDGRKVLTGGQVLVSGSAERGYVRIYVDGDFVGVGLLAGGVLKPERLMTPKS
ncbi:MAG: tRNA pseudouridine(55) synthase TruB [Aquificota bacterium]|nr:tRNA pseudouridine(55) synthase TruB [Aquificota bacterium]